MASCVVSIAPAEKRPRGHYRARPGSPGPEPDRSRVRSRSSPPVIVPAGIGSGPLARAQPRLLTASSPEACCHSTVALHTDVPDAADPPLQSGLPPASARVAMLCDPSHTPRSASTTLSRSATAGRTPAHGLIHETLRESCDARPPAPAAPGELFDCPWVPDAGSGPASAGSAEHLGHVCGERASSRPALDR